MVVEREGLRESFRSAIFASESVAETKRSRHSFVILKIEEGGFSFVWLRKVFL